MKKKHVIIISCFVILAAFICTFYFLFTDSEIQPIDTVLEERGGIIAVYDKTILFMEIHDQNADFFVYDPAAKCGIHIDTIENVKMISHEMILEGHFLYANIILNEKGDPSYTYKINLRDRSATPIHKIESYDTFAPIAKRGDEIAILECKTSDNIHGESIISTFRNSADDVCCKRCISNASNTTDSQLICGTNEMADERKVTNGRVDLYSSRRLLHS